jgi:hypothetical protein
MTMRAALVWGLLGSACGGGGGSTPPADANPGADGDPSVDGAPSEEAERFCAAVSACFEGVAQCFADLPTYPSDFVACAAGASTCVEVYACTATTITEDSSCSEACQSDTLVTCQGTQRFEIDCADTFEGGPHCVVGNYGPVCAARLCSAEETGCAGNVLETCDVAEGVVYGFDCAQFGWTCTEAGGTPRCTDGTTTACSGADRCDGTRLVQCREGYERAFDCADVADGMGCFAGACGYGSECDPAQARGQESCNGTVMTYCKAGKIDTLDCAAYGYTECTENSSDGGACN